MSVDLRIEHDGGGTSTLTEQVGAEWTRDLDEQARAEVTLYRDDDGTHDGWSAVESSVDERNDEFYVVVDGVDEFGGRYDKLESKDATVTLRINSPEIDALDELPTGNNYYGQNVTDASFVNDAISNVSSLSAGTVSTLANSIGYSASYASWSKVIRDMREITGGEILYDGTTDPWTVDYVDRVGTDKSGSVTLGPANQNIGTDFSKEVDEREEVTHVRGFGAQQGPDQVTATATAASYSGGRVVARKYTNKEVYQQSRLQDIVDTLVNEYDGEPRSLDVTCTVYDESLALGDTVYVDYPEEDVDRALRVVSLTTKTSTGGRTQEVTLSTRTLTRQNRDGKRNDDLERFNRGYQGFVDRDQVTSGWNVAGDGIAQELEIPSWPDDIVTEQQVDLTVQGRAWRSPIDISGHTHDVDVTHPSHSHDVTHPQHTHDVTHPSHSHSVSGTTGTVSGLTTQASSTGNSGTVSGSNVNASVSSVSISNTGYPYLVYASAGEQVGSSETLEYLAMAADSGSGRWNVAGHTNTSLSDATPMTGVAWIPENINGDTLTLDIAFATNSGNSTTVEWGWDVYYVVPHSHSISETSSAELGTTETSTAALGTTETSTAALGTTETATSTSNSAGSAAVIDTFGGTTYYPTDVEVRVNGTLITTIAGNASASWQSTVDLRSQLVAGANTITATPTSQRGSINIHLTNELFRRGPKSN